MNDQRLPDGKNDDTVYGVDNKKTNSGDSTSHALISDIESAKNVRATASADLSVTVESDPDFVSAGDDLGYLIEIINNGPDDAQDVVLTDALPPQILYPEITFDNGANWLPWKNPYALGTVANGAKLELQISGKVDPEFQGKMLTNRVSVSSSTYDPDLTNNQNSADTPILIDVNLHIKKTGSPDPVRGGDLLTYHIKIHNYGSSFAHDGLLTDAVPKELSDVEYTLINSEFGPYAPWTGSLSLPEIQDITDVYIRGKVDETFVGTITNTATIKAKEKPDGVSASASTAVIGTAKLSIKKSAQSIPALMGKDTVFILEIRNFGVDVAHNAVVTDHVSSEWDSPAYSVDGGLTYVPWPGTLVLGEIAVGDLKTIWLKATLIAPPPVAAGFWSNEASVTCDNVNPSESVLSDRLFLPIRRLSDLAASIRLSPSVNAPGSAVEYSLTVSNHGPDDAENVAVFDSLSKFIERPEFSVDHGLTYAPWKNPFTLATLPANGSVSISVRGTLAQNAVGEILNSAAVVGSTPDPNPANNAGAVSFDVIDAPVRLSDLSVVKTADVATFLPGATVTYTLKVRNGGPDESKVVTLYDDVTFALDQAEFSQDGGTSWEVWQGSYIIGALAAGAVKIVLIRGNARPTDQNGLLNLASVNGENVDPNPADNASAVEIFKIPASAPESADLAVTMNFHADCAVPCEKLGYTLTIANFGPSDAQNVVVSDDSSQYLCDAYYVVDGKADYAPWTGSLLIDALSAKTTKTIVVIGKVKPRIGNSIVVRAKISSPLFDSDPRNNKSCAWVPVQNCCR